MTRKTYAEGTWEGCVDFLHSLCNKTMLRVHQHRLPIEYDDLFQEASIAFLDSKRAFNPDRGVKFITYLGCAVRNRLSKLVNGAIKGQMSLQTVSLDDAADDESASLHEQLPDGGLRAEEFLELEQSLERRLDELSPLARQVIEYTVNPPAEIEEEFHALRARCRLERERYGYRSVPPAEIDTRFIMTHILPSVITLRPSERNALNRELKRFAEYVR